jgi:hypothetical protein
MASSSFSHPTAATWNAAWCQCPPATTAHDAAIETDAVPCERAHIGRIIGPRGATVNDLQRRSSCRIQIDQANCAVHVTGTRYGIELARTMLGEIEEWGANHPYDGGGGRRHGGDDRVVDDRRRPRRVPSPRGGDDGGDRAAAGAAPGGRPHPPQYPIYLSPPMYPHEPHGPMAPRPGQHPRQEYSGAMQRQPPMMHYPREHRQQGHPYLRPHEGQIQEQDWPRGDQCAAPQAAAAPPSPWMAATTPDGRFYYYNVNTMETRWFASRDASRE